MRGGDDPIQRIDRGVELILRELVIPGRGLQCRIQRISLSGDLNDARSLRDFDVGCDEPASIISRSAVA